MRITCMCFVGLTAFAASAVTAQTVQYRVDPASSLAWWQIDPHYNHLWATTCPDDPSWQPGEGRSPDFRYVFDPNYGDAGVPAKKIPIYERGPVRALCRVAVSGGVVLNQTTWTMREGFVRVTVDSLVTGLHMRDDYAHRMLFQTRDYPEIRFQLDSISNVSSGEGLEAVVHGRFELRGVETSVAVPITGSREGDGWRVLGQTHFPAQLLIDRYGMSRIKLGMGVAMKRWKTVHWGFDLVFQPVGN